MKKQKTDSISSRNTDQNKLLTIFLIIVICFLSSFFSPGDFGYLQKLIMIVPVFTVLFAGYGHVYGFQRLITKIILALLILITIAILILTWWTYQFAKGMGSH